MKVTQSYSNENSDDRKTNRESRAAQERRQNIENDARAAAKSKQTASTVKDELKFAGILKSAENPHKPKRTEEDASQQRRDDDKKDKKRADRQKDSADNLANSDRVEKHNQQTGGNFGGSGGFNNEFNQAIHLSENFAARSILHIADLERMISAIRAQKDLSGRREIHLELKRSILEGLQVKITIEASQTQIEFLAANENSTLANRRSRGRISRNSAKSRHQSEISDDNSCFQLS